MPGIPRELADHALHVNPNAKPVRQPLRRFSEPKRKAIGTKVHRLEKAGFIREIKEATWVANPVLVPKKDTDALRMCIDFTDMNKHSPGRSLSGDSTKLDLYANLRLVDT